MSKNILLIQGHPDAAQDHLCHTLADAYASGAADGGHTVRYSTVAQLDFPLLRNQREWDEGETPASLRQTQDDIRWAQHLVLVYPLWLGDMPALLKGFLEQVARPGFAFARDRLTPLAKKPLAGRSARVIVTMGMPALMYRLYFRAHSVKSLKRNILRFVGISPVHETLIGMAGSPDAQTIAGWVGKMEELGRAAV
ncbi:NAD(P)H-dependent oxidoreductase [Massilia sp. TSP1-1-2]|uniref:NAD(P)H-dependent oxidoreductase n=1 Tax=unclassified Massilia TaxID=2609279 RepID=UPI003CEB8ACE